MVLPERRLYRYKFGSAIYDERAEQLTIRGEPQRIQPQQRALLSALLRRRGEVLGWEDLLDEAWQASVTLDYRPVRMAVMRLRRNLGENEYFVQTISRDGYSFVGEVEREEVYREAITAQGLEPGDAVPRRSEFRLEKRLGGSGTIEAWLARNLDSGDVRVFKITSDRGGVKELKREFVLSKDVQRRLGLRDDIVRVVSLDVREIPYVLESEYGGLDLARWDATGRRLAGLPRDERLALFLRIGAAVAAVHSVPICHGDLKPTNVLVDEHAGVLHIRLIDLGSSVHLDPERLAEIATATLYPPSEFPDDFRRGTLPYMSPQRRAGETSTPADDVYSLGVLLLQFAVGDFQIGIDSGWERLVDDEALRTDIRRATDRDAGARPGSVNELLLDVQRREQRNAARRESAVREAHLRRVAQRRPWVISLFATLVVALAMTSWMYVRAQEARDRQTRQYAVVNAMSRLFIDDFIRAADPSVSGRRNVTVAAAAVSATDKLDAVFGNENPNVLAALHVAMLRTLVSLQEYKRAADEAPKAIARLELGAPGDVASLAEARLLAATALRGVGRFDDAQGQLDHVETTLHLAGPERGELAVRMWHARSLLEGNRSNLPLALAHARLAWRLVSESAIPLAPDVRDEAAFGLSDVERVNGNLLEAERMARVVLASRQERFGENDWRACYARVHLAGILQGQARQSEALALLPSAEQCLEATLGPGSPQAVLAIRVRGNILNDRGDYFGAAKARGEAWRRAAGYSGDLSAVALSERINQANALSLGGDAAGCQAAAESIVALLTPVRTGKESDIQEARFLAVHCRLDRHDTQGVAEALPLLDPESLYRAERRPTWSGRITYERARLAAEQGDLALARTLLEKAAEAFKGEAGRIDTAFAQRVAHEQSRLHR